MFLGIRLSAFIQAAAYLFSLASQVCFCRSFLGQMFQMTARSFLLCGNDECRTCGKLMPGDFGQCQPFLHCVKLNKQDQGKGKW